MPNLGIYTKNADIQARCGTRANATSKDTTATDVYVLNVESFINVATGYDWSTWWAGIGAGKLGVKGILTECGASLCAIKVINWDIPGTGNTRIESEDMINVLYRTAHDCIEVLREAAKRELMIKAV